MNLDDLDERVRRLEEQIAKLKSPAVGDRLEVTKAMKTTAFVLAKHPACKEEWKKFLSQMQSMTSLSAGQGKFYGVIHKECLGSWPDREPISDSPISSVDDMPF